MVHTPRHEGPPPGLAAKKAEWTQRWIQIHADQNDHRDWATAEAKNLLKLALERITHGKCAYCESRLDVSSYAQVEHYTAKTVDPSLVFEWMNLLPACQLCNHAKRDANHGGALLKPDVDQPEEMLWLNPDSGELEVLPGIDGRNADRVKATVALCNLQRGPLCQQRLKKSQLALGAAKTGDERLRDLLLSVKEEYKLAIRLGFTNGGKPDWARLDRERFEAPVTG